MRLPFILSRIALVAVLVAIPLVIWPPPIWLAVPCWVAAGLIYRFGMYNPETRLQRLIVSLSFGFLALATLPGAVEIPAEWVADSSLRRIINAILAQLFRTTANPAFAYPLGAVFIAVCLLEAWRLHLKYRNTTSDVEITAVRGHAVISYDHGDDCYVVEQRVVVTNNSSANVAIRAVRVIDMSGADLKTDPHVVAETIYPLGPGKSIDIAPNADREVHVIARPGLAWFGWLLAVLDRPGLRALPLTFELIIRDARLSFSAHLVAPDKSSQ